MSCNDELAAVSQLPGGVLWSVVRGDAAGLTVTFVDADGDPVDMSGRSMSARIVASSATIATLTPDLSDAATGVIRVPLTDTQSATLTGALYQHLLRDDTNDRVLVDGPLRVATPGSAGVGSGSSSATVSVTTTSVTVTISGYTPGGGGTGDVVGPSSSTDGRAAEFDGATGKLLREAPLTGAGGRPKLDGDGTWADSLIPATIARDTEVTAAVTAHAGAVDPHGDRAYADAGLASKVSTSRTVSAGSGLTGGGDLSADRTIAADFGAGAGKVVEGNDARLSDARTPTAHAASHADGGTDEITVAQSQVTGLTGDLAAKVSTTRTVNGHPLTGDVTVTRADVGLGSVTDDAQLKASQLDVDGTASANSDSKVMSQKAVRTYVAAAAPAGTSILEVQVFS